MTKLTLICNDQETEAKLRQCLRDHQDFIINGAVVLQNVAQEARKGIKFMNQMTASPPDLFILDVGVLRQMAAIDLKVLTDYRKTFSGSQIIVLGNRFHEHNVIVMLKGGAHGFILKDQLAADLIQCIRVVAKGGVWFSVELLERVCDRIILENKKTELIKSPTSEQLAKLNKVSRREMEVLELVSESLTNEEIAHRLFLSNKTVKTHVRNIFEKTGVRNRTEAALLFTRYHQEVESHLNH